jgi:hypothetical protein
MYRLGYATITWIDAAKNEKFDPAIEYKEPPCPGSLRNMREAMIGWTKPEAMVCIGGMEGVESEAEIFRQLRGEAPIYVLEGTGGASLLLAHRRKDIRVIDTEIIRRIDHLRSELDRPYSNAISSKEAERSVVPYPLIMQTIVDEITERGS